MGESQCQGNNGLELDIQLNIHHPTAPSSTNFYESSHRNTFASFCRTQLQRRVKFKSRKKWTFFHEMTSDHSIIYSPHCIISIFLPSRHWLAWPHFISFQGYIQIHFIFFSTRCLYTSLLHVASPSCVACIADDFTRKGNLSPTENRSSFFGVRRLLRLSFFYLVPSQPQTVADASKMLDRWEGEKRENEQCKDKMKGRAVEQSVEKTERE